MWTDLTSYTPRCSCSGDSSSTTIWLSPPSARFQLIQVVSFKLLKTANGVAKVMFSVVSVCRKFCAQGFLYNMPLPLNRAPARPPPQPRTLRHVRICSTCTSLYRAPASFPTHSSVQDRLKLCSL